MTHSYTPRISRRTTLKWVAATAAVSGMPGYSLAEIHAFKPTQNGYGTDPDLLDPVTPWKRTMSRHQLEQVAVLGDLILPATAEAPPPSALGIPEFVDEWVSAPYPEQKADRKVLLNGLAWVDEEARRRSRESFIKAGNRQQLQILDGIAVQNPGGIRTEQNKFFHRLRYLVLGAYYTTQEGFLDIGYVGNVPLDSYPPPSDEEIAILEQELKKLGL
jgi:hypothetical protein